MSHFISKKLLLGIALCTTIFISQAFVQQGHEEMKPKNLKILPKDISHEELDKIMKSYAKALGVRCNHCHAVDKNAPPSDRPHLDFASDDKVEKATARQMMEMVAAINGKYIDKMSTADYKLENITCVTCHMGSTKPIISVDSLMKK